MFVVFICVHLLIQLKCVLMFVIFEQYRTDICSCANIKKTSLSLVLLYFRNYKHKIACTGTAAVSETETVS